MFRYKESEREKISKELLNKLVPMDVLSDYYFFGFTEGMIYIREIIKRCKFIDDEQCNKLISIIDSVPESQEEINKFYERINNSD